MDVHDRMLILAGRDVLFRPIEFERYRKPHVIEYPREAVVLNPQHTRQQHGRNGQQPNGNGRALASSSDSDGDDEEDARRRRNAENGDDEGDDDDPRYMPRGDYLCSDQSLEKVMHLRWREVGPAGLGLVNLGNTCFANSVIQSIAYTPALAQYFALTYRAADNQLGAPYDFAFALGETIRQVHLGRGGGARMSSAYRPGLIVGHLRVLSPHFSIGRQSDAHEFAVQLLNGCQKSIQYRAVGSKKLPLRITYTTALSRICGGYLRSQVGWSRNDEIQQLLKVGKRQAAMDLKMDLSRNRGSGTAGHNPDKMHSNTYDPTNILHVELVGQTLEHCLSKFCGVETLPGRCYHSPRDVPVMTTKQMKLHMPPNVFIIHLKRFTPTGGKISKHIQYPAKLDIFPYTTAAEGPGAAAKHAADPAGYLYWLSAVCIHEGSSISYGHYYAVVRARNGAWYECNDASVSPLSEERALRQQAYMLFYSRVPVDRKAKKTRDAAAVRGVPFGPSRPVPRAVEAGQPVGEELTDEQVAVLLAARRKDTRSSPIMAPAPPPPDSDDDAEVEDDDDEEDGAAGQSRAPSLDAISATVTAKSKNKFASHADDMRQSLKRRGKRLSSEDDEADGDSNGPRPKASRPESRRYDPIGAGVKTVQPSDSGDRSPLRKSIYGGVVKAMRVNPATPLQRALKARNGDGPGVIDPRENPHTRALGRAAVRAIQERKQQAVPETVQRAAAQPKFQQQIRDPMWEMEMDRGRTKKVKAKNAEQVARDANGNRINRFQETSGTRFDRRGRRIGGADEA